ncbi:MAG: ABC transporter permease [Dehalococcoidia bacterium]|nr:ABC transporter permease [Dehalococcoidia bacterium]
MKVTNGSLAIAVVGLILAWEALTLVVASEVLPGPGEVFLALVAAVVKGDLVRHFLVSAARVLVSVALAVAIAAPMGLAVGLSRWGNAIAGPLIYLGYPIPKIVLLPILLMFFGLGDTTKVIMISLVLFFQVLLVVRDAAAGIRAELIQSVRSLGARRRHILRYVYFPACLPAILTSLRVSTGTAIAVLFFVESFGTSSGLGYYILVESWARLAYAQMYAGVVAMALLGLAIYFVLDYLEKRWCAWVRIG